MEFGADVLILWRWGYSCVRALGPWGPGLPVFPPFVGLVHGAPLGLYVHGSLGRSSSFQVLGLGQLKIGCCSWEHRFLALSTAATRCLPKQLHNKLRFEGTNHALRMVSQDSGRSDCQGYLQMSPVGSGGLSSSGTHLDLRLTGYGQLVARLHDGHQ